ncbi:MAG: altronate dehydratase family protein [Streptococcaceae bacterium]|jgi:altronate hydrolase|nr:altronate dehydratase family protein [Streptococcaceae bacterium]
MRNLIYLNQDDNVAVALLDIAAGEEATDGNISLNAKTHIPQGHKIALRDLKLNENVMKYGAPIGHTTEKVEKGSWIHSHNLETNLEGELDYVYQPDLKVVSYPKRDKTFRGYRRLDGRVGVRNDLYIIPMVGCVNGIAERVVQQFREDHAGEKLPFDNIQILKHEYGCSQLGDDHENTRKILADAVHHPNAGGVLVFGLGCENNTMDAFKVLVGKVNHTRVKFLVAQHVKDEQKSARNLLEELLEAARDDHREEVPLSELKVGMKCGGSDGFSGITANPLIGMFSDYLGAQGGSTVLTEVPEMFGAETRLMARAESEEVFHNIVDLINNFKSYFLSYGQPVYENPSPGNKEGGITTLEDKSLGCTQKSGTSPVVDVLSYAEPVRKKGLSLLQGPGNDLVSTTNMAAAGVHLILFSTGRGTPFGTFVPTLKIATHTELAENKPHWIDFDAGRLFKEDKEAVLEDFIEKIIATASGEKTRNEENKFQEIAIFKNGVTL